MTRSIDPIRRDRLEAGETARELFNDRLARFGEPQPVKRLGYDFELVEVGQDEYREDRMISRAIVRAPWTAGQVDRLKARQANPAKHPYTCPTHSTQLVPKPDGWYCHVCEAAAPGCAYHQDWCYAADLLREKSAAGNAEVTGNECPPDLHLVTLHLTDEQFAAISDCILAGKGASVEDCIAAACRSFADGKSAAGHAAQFGD